MCEDSQTPTSDAGPRPLVLLKRVSLIEEEKSSSTHQNLDAFWEVVIGGVVECCSSLVSLQVDVHALVLEFQQRLQQKW